MLRWMLFGVLAMGMLSLNSGSGTLAYFTTQVQSNNNTFTAGNLRFNILDSLTTTGQYPSVGSSMSLLNMKPTDVVYAPIQLNNVGNIPAKFGIKYTTTTTLASNSNGGTISGTATTLVDSGRTAAGLAFGALSNDYVMITAGTDSGDVRKITSVTAPATLNVAAWSATPGPTSVYSVVNYGGTVASGSTTTLVDASAWTINQWVGYTATAGANTSQIVSNTATTLTVSPAFAGVPSGVYSISPTNLAPALTLGIVGRAVAVAGAAPTVLECSTNYANAGIYTQVIRAAAAISSAPTPPLVLDVATSPYTIAPTTGADVLCMQVSFTDHGAPGSLTTGDNIYNGATAGAFSTNINFTFDGQ
jgi:predicted ribosomally synthesized peptide with SipW-like signal peptide